MNRLLEPTDWRALAVDAGMIRPASVAPSYPQREDAPDSTLIWDGLLGVVPAETARRARLRMAEMFAMEETWRNPNRAIKQPNVQSTPAPWTAEQVREYERKKAQADGISRAVANLNSFDPRLGSARWQP